MNIFRKCYNLELLEKDFLYDFNKLGFNQLDGTPYDTEGGFANQKIILHWKKDKTYTIPSGEYVFTNSPVPYISNLSGPALWFYKPKSSEYEFGRIGQITIYINNTIFMDTVFIPLINNGFCLLFYQGRIQQNGEDWYANHPTLPIFSFNNDIEVDWNNKRYINSFIGLKTNLTDNPYSYITRMGFESPKFWSGNGSQESISIPGVDESEHQDTVSYNANVCTLAKIPYNSTYVNGMYLCTTSPFQDGVSGKTFSFGGRTFIGMYNNLVLEMPNN